MRSDGTESRWKKDPMRVLMVTFDPPSGSGGIEGRAVAYTKALRLRSVYVEVAALAPGNQELRVPYHGTRLTRLSASIGRLPRTIGALTGTLSQSSIDTVLLLSGGSTPIGTLLIGYCLLTRRRGAALFYGRDVLQARHNPINRIALCLSLLLAGGVGANSRHTAGLLPFRPRGRLTIVYPGVDPGVTDDIASPGVHAAPRILFVGRLVRRKGADLLISAFASLRSEFPDLKLDLVGDGPEAGSLRGLADRLGLGDSVTFHGELHGSSLWNRYAAATLFAMPSRVSPDDTEGFGTVYLEAGVFGIPSVGTRVGGIPEAIADGVTGRLVDSEDVEQLKGAIRGLLVDRVERGRLGANAKRRAAGMTWEASTEALMYALQGKPRTPPRR